MSYSEDLLHRQNSDGGWGYDGGGSWTEPTCYALLALAAGDLAGSEAARRGALWLAPCQRSDGGLAPRESVAESTWLTALALLLPASLLPEGSVDRRRAGSWVAHQTGRESGCVNRLRLWMLGVSPQDSLTFDGWPWFTGTAAWVIPTAISILALEKLGREGGGSELSSRVFFFSSRRRHTRLVSDWSSDVCSSDLAQGLRGGTGQSAHGVGGGGYRDPDPVHSRRHEAVPGGGVGGDGERHDAGDEQLLEIGRASGRERG